MKSTIVTLLLAAITFMSCSKDSPGYQPEVVNKVDSFSLHASTTSNVSNYFEYKWNNTGSKANISIATQAKAAKMDVKVYDSNGLEVYSNSLDNVGSFTTNQGVAGTWKIVIVFESFSGNLQLDIKKSL